MGRKRQRYSRRSAGARRDEPPRKRVNPTRAVDTLRFTGTHYDYGLMCGHHVKISQERHPIAIRSAMACRVCGRAALPSPGATP